MKEPPRGNYDSNYLGHDSLDDNDDDDNDDDNDDDDNDDEDDDDEDLERRSALDSWRKMNMGGRKMNENGQG